MQEFDIKGKTTVTATIKAQIDDSPLALPPAYKNNIQENPFSQNNTPESFSFNSAILEEFGDIIPEVTKNLKAMNDTVLSLQHYSRLNDQPKVTERIFDYSSSQESNLENDNGLNSITRVDDLKNIEDSVKDINDNLQKISGIVSGFKLQPESSVITDNTNVEDYQSKNIINSENDIVADDPINENLQRLPETIQNNVEVLNDNVDIVKEYGNVLPVLLKQFQNMNDIVAKTNSNLPAIGRAKTSEEIKKQRRDEYDRQNFLNVFNTGSGAIQALSYGNIGGAGQGLITGASNAVSNYAKIADLKELEGLSKTLLVGGTGLMAAAAVFKGGKALSDAYKDSMPTIFNTGKAFGTTDNDESMRLYKTVNKYSEGTNLENSEFNELVQSLRKQGIGNQYNNKTSQAIAASQIAETTAKWAYATNGDTNQYAQLAGLMSRYGGSKNVSEDFNYLVASGKAQGLNDTQIPEFLSGIQKVMEEGIAKGFTRSSKEVADTMLMFSKMSGGNAFWQSDKGAKMLNQMNSGISSATSLSKTEDILTYQAFSSVYSDEGKIKEALNKKGGNQTYIEGGGYINKMQLIEQGVNADNFGALMEYAKKASGGSEIREAEILKNMFGLNYTGVGALKNLNMAKITDKGQLEKEIQKITQAPENLNNETKWKNDLNRVAQALESGGAKIFGSVTLKGMDAISGNVEKIAKYLIKDEEKKSGEKPVLSTNNPILKQREEEGSVNAELYENQEIYEKRVKQLPQYKQKYALSLSSTIDPGANGEGYLKIADMAENLDLTKTTWDSPFVEKASYDDLGFWEKKAYDKGNRVQQNNLLYEKGFKLNKNFKDDTSVEDVTAEIFSLKLKSLLSKNTVSQDDLMKGIASSKEYDEALTKAAKNGWIDNKEQVKLAEILQEIFNTLEAGITVTKES